MAQDEIVGIPPLNLTLPFGLEKQLAISKWQLAGNFKTLNHKGHEGHKGEAVQPLRQMGSVAEVYANAMMRLTFV